MKLVLNIFECVYQISSILIVSIIDKEKDNFYLTNSNESEFYSVINQD